MEITSPRQLHRSMIAISNDMQQFLVRTGAASFNFLFSTRDTPSVLTLTARGFFWFDVLAGYRIRDYLGDMYGDLLEVLKEDGSSGHRPIPKEFLAELNDAIPIQATEKGPSEACGHRALASGYRREQGNALLQLLVVLDERPETQC